MMTIRTVAWLLPLTLASSAYGACAQHTTPSATTPVGTTAPSERAATAQRDERAEHGARADGADHAVDPANALLRATERMPLNDAQKVTVASLEQQLEANRRDTGAAFQTFRSDLAAQVRTGAIDQDKVQIDQSAASTALQTHAAKEVDTLNGLHAALDPSQRKAAVAEVRAQQPAAPEPQAQGGADAGAAPTAEDIAKRRQERMTRELDLDATQQQQVASLLAAQPAPKRAPMQMMEDRRRRTDALLAAFESDTFDAQTAAPAPATSPAEMVREGTSEEVAFLSRLLPILRPDQRDKLASNMEARGAPAGQTR